MYTFSFVQTMLEDNEAERRLQAINRQALRCICGKNFQQLFFLHLYSLEAFAANP
jgi:hypothetical protein